MGGKDFKNFGNKPSAFNKSSNGQKKNAFKGFGDFDFEGF